jgi:hypothetical protein
MGSASKPESSAEAHRGGGGSPTPRTPWCCWAPIRCRRCWRPTSDLGAGLGRLNLATIVRQRHPAAEVVLISRTAPDPDLLG